MAHGATSSPRRSTCYPAPVELIAGLTDTASADPLAALAQPPEGATVVELRADLVPGLAPSDAVAACPLPLLFTLRSEAEGGRGPDDPAQRTEILRRARDSGVALLDLETSRDRELIGRLGLEPERVVLSWHDPAGTPEDLEARARAMLEAPARWVKVVPTAATLRELEAVLSLHLELGSSRPEKRRLIAFSMGPVGLASRYLAPLLGPPLAFVAWSEGAPAAPGQITAARLLAVVGHLRGRPSRLYGVVGADVSRSLSPLLHSAAYRELDLPYLFIPLSVPSADELDHVFVARGRGLFDRLGLETGGWAVTTPYKRRALAAATVAAPRAKAADAANTLILGPDRVVADTTDADGVVGALVSRGIDPRGAVALVQGLSLIHI